MKIISRDDRKIVIQREEFVINLSSTQVILTVILAILFIRMALYGSDGGILAEFPPLWHLEDGTNPLLIGVVALGAIGLLGEFFIQLWDAIKSPTRTKLWDRYTFDQEQDDITNLPYKWSKISNLGLLSEIKNIEIVVDINYSSEADDPENVDTRPTSLYRVVMTFEGDRQVELERNAIQLASSDKVQQLFRQTLTETNQVVLELRTFLGLSGSIDGQATIANDDEKL
jgi:hypothetical protein